MKKAFVLDWLDRYGGAERVIGNLEKIFDFDVVYTLINNMSDEDLGEVNLIKKPIKETVLKKTGSKFRWFYVFFFFLISRIKIDKDVNLIVSSSHSVAKGVRKSKSRQIHISYFHARNSNYIWDEVDLYFGKLKFLFFPIIFILRKLDLRQAQNPDYIICNSRFVQEWVTKIYKRTSVVIYPPVDFSNFSLEKNKSDYYVAVGRIVAIKRFDVIVKTFNENKKNLIVIGDGDQYSNLKKMALSDNIKFTGFLDSKQVNSYVRHAKGFIQMGVEGFGIASLEAQACGTPIIAFGQGGILETVVPNKTGILFQHQTKESLNNAIKEFEQIQFSPVEIRKHALTFSKENFEKEIVSFVNNVLKIH